MKKDNEMSFFLEMKKYPILWVPYERTWIKKKKRERKNEKMRTALYRIRGDKETDFGTVTKRINSCDIPEMMKTGWST